MHFDLPLFILTLDLFGTVVFAMAGVLAAAERRLDLFGVIVVGTVTAIGGGTLRDLILGRLPVFWVQDNLYIWITVTTSVVVFALARKIRFPHMALQVADAIGLSVFTIIGANVALNLGHPPLIAVVTGVMTGVFGGIVRDVLTAVKPMIFEKEIYATAVMAGAFVYVNLNWFLPSSWETFNTLVSMAVVLGLRLAAIRWGLHLPVFLAIEDQQNKKDKS
ncbi:trimeric intracellular cation channel family protein [Marinospirillum alkaliphilum]|uniref:Uncharacterized membrane protein YeiH n=1 Tax=Marinospirillum alkaliphilum DSM 21637 TaxID=1122209 RepID=A0A1K1XI75_9GAMM|nr:trimeric intracellular cation channel family protein [Marinospirillum alkaliphilum]SFX49287.1 Uncharacterized membrane protein YeiH [Marinospirillum alkaliphilum DSM 21637]